MLITTQQWQSVLSGEVRNPDIIPGNRPPQALQFIADLGVVFGSFLIDGEHSATRGHLSQPSFIALPVPRLPDPVPVFPEDDYRQDNFSRLAQERLETTV